MPARRMSYVTVALAGEVTLTAVTVADADFARPEPAWASITAANFCPFCSREIFFAAEVVPLKNASQFVLIWAAALELPADADADDAGADDDGAELVEAELLELLQAVTAEASARPSAAARITRRATSRNRVMCRPPPRMPLWLAGMAGPASAERLVPAARTVPAPPP